MLELKHSNVIVIAICVSLLFLVFISLQKPETHSLYLSYDYDTPANYKVYKGEPDDRYMDLDPFGPDFDEIESELELVASGTLASSLYYKVNDIQENGSYTILFESDFIDETSKTKSKCVSFFDLDEGDMIVDCKRVRYLSGSLRYKDGLELQVKNYSMLKLFEGLDRIFCCLVCGPLSI